MKHLPRYILISTAAFTIGLIVVSSWLSKKTGYSKPQTQKIVRSSSEPLAELQVGEQPETDEFSDPLEKVWLDDKTFSYEGYTIIKECSEVRDNYNYCSLSIKKNEKILAGFESDYVRDNWLQYGFFNFLGEADKQLIVHTYSGGAHCCYDYVIYDLKPTFRAIYDSRKYDSGSEIGNDLTPADIDGDGRFEFERSVMAFDYFHASHADSVFPPAVFAYDKNKGRYDFANKKFPDYVLNELKENLVWLDKQRNESGDESNSLKEMNERYIVRKTFLNLVYAGKEKEGLKYFDENYDFEGKEEYRKDVVKQFTKDITYKSIYQK